MFKIGVVDLDTSHPISWFPKIKAYDDMEIVMVWDSGTVNPRSFLEEYAQKNNVAIAETIEEMVPHVDAAIIHGADWDLHVDKAIPFVEAGKAVLIDKPMVGKLRDIDRLLDLSKKNPDVPIIGGSSVRFCQEVEALKAQKDELGSISAAFVSGPNDFFSYGIHTVELFQGFFGEGVKCVSYLGENGGELFQATYKDGTIVIYQLHAPSHEWFFSLTSSKGSKSFIVDNSKIYDALIAKFHEMLKTGKSPLPLTEFLEAVKIQLAAKEARQTGKTIYLEDLGYNEGFDGKAFTEQYRMNKWKGKY
jgi:predicted dehydrogenase